MMSGWVLFIGLALFALVVLFGCQRIDGVGEYQSCMECGYKFGGSNETQNR